MKDVYIVCHSFYDWTLVSSNHKMASRHLFLKLCYAWPQSLTCNPSTICFCQEVPPRSCINLSTICLSVFAGPFLYFLPSYLLGICNAQLHPCCNNGSISGMRESWRTYHCAQTESIWKMIWQHVRRDILTSIQMHNSGNLKGKSGCGRHYKGL